MLGAVSVMHIPIKHRDTFHVVLGAEVLNADSHVVIYAETVNSIPGAAMMSGRSYNCERIAPLARLNIIDALNYPANC